MCSTNYIQFFLPFHAVQFCNTCRKVLLNCQNHTTYTARSTIITNVIIIFCFEKMLVGSFSFSLSLWPPPPLSRQLFGSACTKTPMFNIIFTVCKLYDFSFIPHSILIWKLIYNMTLAQLQVKEKIRRLSGKFNLLRLQFSQLNNR